MPEYNILIGSLVLGGGTIFAAAFNLASYAWNTSFINYKVFRGASPDEALHTAREANKRLNAPLLPHPLYVLTIPGREIAFLQFKKNHGL